MTQASPTQHKTLLSAQGITKRFPGVVANSDVSFTLQAGEVHALLGENGAGKTTLISMLYGLYPPDEGELLRSGRPVRFRAPKDALPRESGSSRSTLCWSSGTRSLKISR